MTFLNDFLSGMDLQHILSVAPGTEDNAAYPRNGLEILPRRVVHDSSKEFSGYEYARSSVYTTYSRLNRLGLNAGKSVRENLTSHRYTGQ